jgi:hypothetical protein
MEEGLPEDGEVLVVADIKREVRTRIGATPGSLLLVRPDGHVAFHTTIADQYKINTLLSPWLQGAADEADVLSGRVDQVPGHAGR